MIALYEHSLDGLLEVVYIDTSGYSRVSGMCKIHVMKNDINGKRCRCVYSNIFLKDLIR